MQKWYKKGDEVRVFDVENGKVLTSICVNDVWVSNPTEKAFKADGWKEFTPPAPEPYVPTIEELVQDALRNGADGGTPTYSIPQEFEVQRKRESDPEAFAAYNARVEACIAWANEQPHREGSGGENV